MMWPPQLATILVFDVARGLERVMRPPHVSPGFRFLFLGNCHELMLSLGAQGRCLSIQISTVRQAHYRSALEPARFEVSWARPAKGRWEGSGW